MLSQALAAASASSTPLEKTVTSTFFILQIHALRSGGGTIHRAYSPSPHRNHTPRPPKVTPSGLPASKGAKLGLIKDWSAGSERRRIHAFMSANVAEKDFKIEALEVEQLLLDPENPRLEGMGHLNKPALAPA
jgi:hypothetical protein